MEPTVIYTCVAGVKLSRFTRTTLTALQPPLGRRYYYFLLRAISMRRVTSGLCATLRAVLQLRAEVLWRNRLTWANTFVETITHLSHIGLPFAVAVIVYLADNTRKRIRGNSIRKHDKANKARTRS